MSPSALGRRCCSGRLCSRATALGLLLVAGLGVFAWQGASMLYLGPMAGFALAPPDPDEAPAEAPAFALLGRPRQALAEWLTSAATLEEVRTLQTLRALITRTKAATVADILGKLTSEQRWFECASEHELCSCTSGAVRFGREPRWVKLPGPAKESGVSVKCSASNFGGTDPAVGVLKGCECHGPLMQAAQAPGRSCGSGCQERNVSMYNSPPRPRGSICGGDTTHELLWGCGYSRAVPPAGHRHAEPQGVLNRSAESLCQDSRFRGLLSTYLDCGFLESFLRWTGNASDWLEEAYVSYIAGKQNSKHEWMATNLIRSVHLFSSRPIVVVVFDNFVPPPSWHEFPNLIVYRMLPGLSGVSFNFNKIRAMIGARIVSGIELDGDQIIYQRMDRVFNTTRRECTAQYPFPIMPVHWMARDSRPGEPYHAYAFRVWKKPHGMRWCHAHPTWTFWALAFLLDLLHTRLAAQAGGAVPLLPLSGRRPTDLRALLARPGQDRASKDVRYEAWMQEDEDMLNVELWMANATKAWCKFDLEPSLFTARKRLERHQYYDPRWYPDGVPLLFLSAHNTKVFESTDSLLTLLAQCSRPAFAARRRCPDPRELPGICNLGTLEEARARQEDPERYAATVCCCLEPRQERPIYWAGSWYRRPADVPERSPDAKAERRCILT